MKRTFRARPIAICLAILVSITTSNSQAVFATDLPPKMDYSSLVVSTSLIAGEYLEISFRATDDVGINTMGPVVSIRSIEYPKLFFLFRNCDLSSGDRKDGNWKCKVPTEKTNPLGKYNLIVVITDTVGQHSVLNPGGWDTVALFEMREKTAAEKAEADKAEADKAAADKAAAEKAAADKAAADKAAADARATALKRTTIICVKGKLSKKITAIKPKCPAGYKKK